MLPPQLPEGEVEVILLYEREQVNAQSSALSPLSWYVLKGGRYLGGALRREELYDNDRLATYNRADFGVFDGIALEAVPAQDVPE